MGKNPLNPVHVYVILCMTLFASTFLADAAAGQPPAAVTVSDGLDSTPVVLEGSHTVSEGVVVAGGSSTVIAKGTAIVRAQDHASVEASEGATVEARNHANVVASGTVRVFAFDEAKVYAFEESKVMAHKTTTIFAFDHATVVAWNRARINVYDNANVLAFNQAHIIANGDGRIDTMDDATVERDGQILQTDSRGLVFGHDDGAPLCLAYARVLIEAGRWGEGLYLIDQCHSRPPSR